MLAYSPDGNQPSAIRKRVAMTFQNWDHNRDLEKYHGSYTYFKLGPKNADGKFL
jgi:hypothetical protein